MTQKNLYKDSPIASISFYKECLLPRYELMIVLVFNKHDKIKKISVALALHQFYLVMTYLKIAGRNHEPIAYFPYLSRE